LLADKTQGASCVRKRKATFGGVIEATFEDGRSIQYGMTAGHAVEDFLSTNSAESSEVDSEDDSDSEEDVQAQNHLPAQQSPSLKLADDWLQDSSLDSWDSLAYTPLSSVLNNNKLPGVLARRALPSLDWALFEIDSPKPNVLCTLEYSEQPEKGTLRIASRPGFGDNLCDPVIMMGSSGLKRGRLSSLPGAILRGNSKAFVQTYMLELDEGHGT
jgi:hypothetical protein